MTAVLLGLLAALCWSIHDLLARSYAEETGPFRMAVWILLIGAALLVVPVAWRATLFQADSRSYVYAFALGISYAVAIGGLLKAFSLAPISIVAPFTSWYPALVVIWGLLHGLTPTVSQWSAVAMILVGVIIVARFGNADGGMNAIAPGKTLLVVMACAAACLGFSASIILGQTAAATLGEFETTMISRLPAAAVLLPLVFTESRAPKPPTSQKYLTRSAWIAIFIMALVDVIAVTAINYSGRFDGKEFAGMGISAYGASTVLLARIFLKESVSALQWIGIAMIATGVGILGWSG